MSHKSLAGVEENLAALHDHALDGKVLPDIFCLAHFVMHDSRNRRTPHYFCNAGWSVDSSCTCFFDIISVLLVITPSHTLRLPSK